MSDNIYYVNLRIWRSSYRRQRLRFCLSALSSLHSLPHFAITGVRIKDGDVVGAGLAYERSEGIAACTNRVDDFSGRRVPHLNYRIADTARFDPVQRPVRFPEAVVELPDCHRPTFIGSGAGLRRIYPARPHFDAHLPSRALAAQNRVAGGTVSQPGQSLT